MNDLQRVPGVRIELEIVLALDADTVAGDDAIHGQLAAAEIEKNLIVIVLVLVPPHEAADERPAGQPHAHRDEDVAHSIAGRETDGIAFRAISGRTRFVNQKSVGARLPDQPRAGRGLPHRDKQKSAGRAAGPFVVERHARPGLCAAIPAARWTAHASASSLPAAVMLVIG